MTAALLNYDDTIYDFLHAMAHRNYLAVMSPLSNYSAIPYFIEPWPLPLYPQAADSWNLNHQQAHNDFSNNLPGYWSADSIGFGIPLDQNLIDSNLNEEAGQVWWTFANHQEHLIATGVVYPYPGTLPTGVAPGWWNEVTLQYPFW